MDKFKDILDEMTKENDGYSYLESKELKKLITDVESNNIIEYSLEFTGTPRNILNNIIMNSIGIIHYNESKHENYKKKLDSYINKFEKSMDEQLIIEIVNDNIEMSHKQYHKRDDYFLITNVTGDILFGYFIVNYKINSKANSVWLSELFVDASYRGLGISKACLDFITDFTKAINKKYIVLGTIFESNAHKLYESKGFKVNAVSMYLEIK